MNGHSKQDGGAVANGIKSKPSMARKKSASTIEKQCVVDGCWAVAHAAYRMNDAAYIFPITPSSPMGEMSMHGLGSTKRICGDRSCVYWKCKVKEAPLAPFTELLSAEVLRRRSPLRRDCFSTFPICTRYLVSVWCYLIWCLEDI